jgi:hypothetical protein
MLKLLEYSFVNCNNAAGESVTNPPSPVLFLLSSEGLLICYYMIYTAASVAPVNIKPESLTGACTRQRQGISWGFRQNCYLTSCAWYII